jgi:hypothetical protein
VAKQKIKTERINMKVAPEFKKRAERQAQKEDSNLSSYIQAVVVKDMDTKDWLDS